MGKYHSAKSPQGKLLGFKTLITPSKEAQRGHRKRLKDLIRQARGWDQEALIHRLNRVVPGWARYYRTVVSSDCFAAMDSDLHRMLWQWAQWRHNAKGKKWVGQKYRRRIGLRQSFSTPEEVQLQLHGSVKIQRHTKVAGTASPYDGKLAYWAKRNYEHPLTKSRKGVLLRRQHGRCAYCGLYLTDEELVEIDHIIPKRLGGNDALENLQALHRHCHDKKTAKENQPN